MTQHGAALVEQVIAEIEADEGNSLLQFSSYDFADGPWVNDPRTPMPDELLAAATFPSGRALPPSLRRWLAFDTGMLRKYGWLDGAHRFTPLTFGELCIRRYGDEWAGYFERSPMAKRFTECFLLPGGADSCRMFVTDSVDEFGEYPVLALDIDDLPDATLMYPGFDVFLAENAGIVKMPPYMGYAALAKHPDFAGRMTTHSAQCFADSLEEDCFGARSKDYFGDEPDQDKQGGKE